jgi:hypothetical protein
LNDFHLRPQRWDWGRRNKYHWTHPYHWILYQIQSSHALAILEVDPFKYNDQLIGDYARVFTHLHCSDVRDRIYAALPFLRVHYTEKQFSLTPDYSLSVSELFEAVYDRYPREEMTSNRGTMSRQMRRIQILLELDDPEDEAVKRVFAKMWGLPIEDAERLSAEELEREVTRLGGMNGNITTNH